MRSKYAVKIPFDGKYLWITEGTGKPFPNSLKVRTFDTREDAKVYAQPWTSAIVEEYNEGEEA